MSRRVNMPTADDLFRPTSASGKTGKSPVRAPGIQAVPDEAPAKGPRRTSGRVRHEEKMTVYVTAEELVHIESARLNLRSELGLAVDRGRLVREAIAIVLEDLEKNGSDSDLVRRILAQ
ncbi:MAG TPA: hypothetical protein PKA04_08795 [Marmoricola sp.]|nr:hypothetical protein [Nocardioidaceae bacterium]HMU36912.1 hypothetical protein [Marmoricola sp.]HMY08181.1 hypothetical protein [Marmoricola sp.]